MALADFFRRDTVAISQVLQGFETDAFIEQLESVRVAIAFGEEAATSRDGRELLDLSVRLMARLYPRLTFATVPAYESFADELMTLARKHQPQHRGVHDEHLPTLLSRSERMHRPSTPRPYTLAATGGWATWARRAPTRPATWAIPMAPASPPAWR